ncbi:hypothetical protein H4R24_001266 [Coemansia sp. RSA 988]|nr:hypothetical protein H4R24_001266 [Coemansia sp. RSA 988]
MADFADSGNRGAAQPGNPFRPYAEPIGSRTTGSNGSYDEVGNPLEGLRNMSSDPFRMSGLPIEVNGLDDVDAVTLGYDEQLDTAQAAIELLKFAGYRYLTTLGASPFAIAQTLLQVQHLPTAVRESELTKVQRELTEQPEDEVPDPDDPAYYEYLRARHSGRGDGSYRPAGRAHVDHHGYIVGAHDRDSGDTGKPGYQLEALPTAKLTVLRKLIGHPTEGVLSMFKGAFTQWVYEMLHLLLQPTLEGLLNEMLGLYDNAPLSTYIDSSAPSALTLVASSVAVGWLLSPLELLRTRLIVQSSSPIHRKYRGLIHGLRTIAREEGGLRSLYFSPFNLVPTLVKHTLDPIFRNMGSFAIDRVAGIDPYDHPTAFALGGLVWKTISAVVMLPVDTVRTRLQAQPRYTKKGTNGSMSLLQPKGKSAKAVEPFREFRTCVPLAAVPYTGMANCAWRIVSEEGLSLKKMRKQQAAAIAASSTGNTEEAHFISNVGHYGLRGLYPGLALQLVANVAIFGLSFIESDDAEIAF